MNYKEKYNFILGSLSPRRKKILNDLGFNILVKSNKSKEIILKDLPQNEIVENIAKQKAKTFIGLKKNDILITADTIVCLENQILGKPKDKIEAKKILKSLSNNKNNVYTGVCIKTKDKQIVFSEKTSVFFKKLEDKQIDFYIKKYKPFDKAGAYGIQEWIGMVGIEKIEGCYYNVVGFPCSKFLEKLEANFL